MTDKPSQSPPGSKSADPWRVERMVQDVPGHLNEEPRLSPWLLVAGIAAVVLLGGLLLYFNQMPTGPVSAGISATDIPVPSPTRRVTVIRITATPQPTETDTPVPTPVIVKYTVKKGDSLSTIAKQFKVSVEVIRAANNLKDDTIVVGKVLLIPQGGGTPGAVIPGNSLPTGGSAPATQTSATGLVLRTPTLMSFGPPTVPAVSATPSPTPGVVTYVVRANDNLISIASTYSTTVDSIMAASNLDSPGLRVGQTITVPVGLWIPTVTPTTWVSPTPTSVPLYSYSAPDLLFPVDQSDFAHGTSITLQWLSLGIKSDEYYVVHLSYTQNGVTTDLPGYIVHYDEGTAVTLDESPAPGGSSAEFSWYVVVVRSNGCGPGSPPDQPCAVSPVSDTYHFNWR